MKINEGGEMIMWRQDDVKPVELPDAFIEFLRREGVIE